MFATIMNKSLLLLGINAVQNAYLQNRCSITRSTKWDAIGWNEAVVMVSSSSSLTEMHNRVIITCPTHVPTQYLKQHYNLGQTSCIF